MRTDISFRKLFCMASATCAALVALTAGSSSLAEGSFDGSKARVNLSNKLEMLAQTIGSASCRLNAGIGPDEAVADLMTARSDFNTIMSGLEAGSTALGIPSAEKHAVVLKAIKSVQEAWAPIDEAAETLASGGGGNAPAADVIVSNSEGLLAATRILASDISGRYSNPHELTQADAMALRIAGRQRTLGHRITMEVCGIVTGAEAIGTVDTLGESLDTYNISLNALRDGMADAGVNPPPNDVIRAELESVSQVWEETRPTLAAIQGGMAPSADNVASLAQMSSALMTDMSNVVTLYMLATPGQENVYRVPLQAYAEEQLTKWVENEALIQAVRDQNAAHQGLSQNDIDRLDQEWRAQAKAEDKPLINKLLSQPVSEWLRAQQGETANFVTEVFAMDNHGLNVAQSVQTSDYWQGDEAKWKNTFGNGSGDIHISEVEYDDSTGTYQSQVSMPISDPATGELIGAITFGINVQSLL